MKVKALLRKLGSTICALALFVGMTSVNSACFAWFHQPKVPEGMKWEKK